MALLKEIKDNKGIIAKYHRIGIVSQVYGQAIYINLFGYADESYREIEKNTDENLVLINTPIVLPFVDEDYSRDTLYNRIKKEVELFNDALDI